MGILRSLAAAFISFTYIPLPFYTWRESDMKYILGMLPALGVVVGLAQLFWWVIASWLGVSHLFLSVGFLVIPLFVTGGIHMDGFCDVCDALASHAQPDRKHEILKDSRVGAFAIIFLCVYLLVFFAALYELRDGLATVVLLGCVAVASRCVAGYASLLLPKNTNKGMLAAQTKDAHAAVSLGLLVFWTIASLGIAFWVGGLFAALAILLAGCLAFIQIRRIAKHEFEGMSGDLAGFTLQATEVLACLFLAFVTAGGLL